MAMRLDDGSAPPLTPLPPVVFAWAGVALIALYLAARLSIELRRRRRRRASALRFTAPPPARLSPGLSTLAGVVETDEPDGVAIRICAPRESFALGSIGEPRWRIWAPEAARSCEVHPFTLVVGAGVRVRVRPEADVDLLSWPESLDDLQHALTLRAGERALVRGVLACSSPNVGAYRGEEHAFVLHAPRGGSLMIETEPFAESRDRLPRRYRRIVDIMFGVAAAFHLVLLGSPDPTAMFVTVLAMLVIALAWGSFASDGP